MKNIPCPPQKSGQQALPQTPSQKRGAQAPVRKTGKVTKK